MSLPNYQNLTGKWKGGRQNRDYKQLQPCSKQRYGCGWSEEECNNGESDRHAVGAYSGSAPRATHELGSHINPVPFLI